MVTFRSISKKVNISFDQSREILENLKRSESDIEAYYMVCGEMKNELKVILTRENMMETKKSNLNKVLNISIHSLRRYRKPTLKKIAVDNEPVIEKRKLLLQPSISGFVTQEKRKSLKQPLVGRKKENEKNCVQQLMNNYCFTSKVTKKFDKNSYWRNLKDEFLRLEEANGQSAGFAVKDVKKCDVIEQSNKGGEVVDLSVEIFDNDSKCQLKGGEVVDLSVEIFDNDKKCQLKGGENDWMKEFDNNHLQEDFDPETEFDEEGDEAIKEVHPDLFLQIDDCEFENDWSGEELGNISANGDLVCSHNVPQTRLRYLRFQKCFYRLSDAIANLKPSDSTFAKQTGFGGKRIFLNCSKAALNLE